MSNETSEERDNARNSSVPQEGTDQGVHILSCMCFCACIVHFVLCLACDVTAAFALHDSLKRVPERGGSTCVLVSKCVCVCDVPSAVRGG